jgi:hypothetical protein
MEVAVREEIVARPLKPRPSSARCWQGWPSGSRRLPNWGRKIPQCRRRSKSLEAENAKLRTGTEELERQGKRRPPQSSSLPPSRQSPRPAAAAKTKIQEETRRATQAQVGVAGRNFRKAEKLTFYFFSPRRGRTRRFRLTSNSRRWALARCQDSLPVGVPRSMDLCNMADFAAGKKRFLRFACVQCPCEARPIPPGSAPG